jgi:transcriptional regulator with XRE-family HTH domain
MGRSVNPESCLLSRVPLSASEQQVLKKLGASVKKLRSGKGMTQERLAELCDLHLRSLQKIEAGEKNVLVTTVQRIQRALSCSWDELMK